MNNSPKVSIIVPVYNVEKYILQCLQSIKEQTYSNLEVIVVDDGTPDKSAELCKVFMANDERFTLLTKENGGLSSARNYGIEHATGEYVCFIDSDDYVESKYVEHLLEKIGDAEVVIGKYILDDRDIGKRYIPYENQKINEIYLGERKKREIVERLLFDGLACEFEIEYSIMPVWKNMYRKGFLDEEAIRFKSEREVYMEDYLFNLEVYCKAKKVAVIDNADYVHLNLRGTLSQKYRKDFFKMQMTRFRYASDIICAKYGCEEKEVLNQTLPYLIAYSAFKCVQCDYVEAMSNLDEIVRDKTCSSVIREGRKGIMPKHIEMIFKLLKHNRKREIFISVKVMYFMRKVYGFFRMRK